MAGPYFWVGGTGTWDNVSTANWSLSSGGASGAGPPTSADIANITTSTGTGTITIASTAAAGTLNFSSTTITTSFSGGETLGAVVVTGGTFTTGAVAHTWTSFTSTSGTRTLTLDNSTINITGTSGTPISLSSTSLTFSNTNTTWNVNGGTANTTLTLTLSNLAYATFNITGAGIWNMNCNGSFKAFSYTSTADKRDTLQLVANPTIAASGSLTIAGNSVVNRAFVRGQVLGTQQSISVPNTATVTLTNVDFQDIASAGTFGTWTGTSLGDALGNSGITFDPSVSLTWDTSKTGAQNWSGSNWLGTTNRVPLPQDDVILPAIGSATTITMDTPRIGRNNDWSPFNRTLGPGSITHTIFGNLALGASSTLTTDSQLWQGRGAQTVTSNGKALPGGNVTQQAFGGTYTLQDAISGISTFTLSNGTFDSQGFDVSTGALSSSGAVTRAIKGTSASTWSVSTTSGNIVSTSATLTTTNFAATIKLTGNISTTATFVGSGLTWGNLWWSNTAATGTLIITGANTFNDFKINRTTARSITFPAGPTTIASWTDENLGTAILTVGGGGSSAKLTKVSGTVASDYLNVTNIDAPALPDASLWYAGTHSVNNSGTRFIFTDVPSNTGAPIPERVYRPNRTHDERSDHEHRLRAFSEMVDLLEVASGVTKPEPGVQAPTDKEIKAKAQSLDEGDDRRQILELLDRIAAVEGENARRREQLVALHTAYRIEAELQARAMDDEEAILVLLLSE